MKLTKSEEATILRSRKKAEAERPKLTATLKWDLYFHNSRGQYIQIELPGWWLQKDQIKNALDNYLKSVEESSLKAPKGTKFVCYIDKGKQLWYDCENIGLEEMSSAWAKANLENIKKLTK